MWTIKYGTKNEEGNSIWYDSLRVNDIDKYPSVYDHPFVLAIEDGSVQMGQYGCNFYHVSEDETEQVLVSKELKKYTDNVSGKDSMEWGSIIPIELPPDGVNVMVTYRKTTKHSCYSSQRETSEIVTKRGFYTSLFDHFSIPPGWAEFKGALLPNGWGGDRLRSNQIIKWEHIKDV